jgi:RNA polymerase sigma-70 factor (ECF subfamily)
MSEAVRDAVDVVARDDAGRIVAALIRIAGSFDLAEDALHDAFGAALMHWPRSGVPRNPAAWIMAVAQRKLIDFGRRARTQRDNVDALTYELTRSPADPAQDAVDAQPVYPDDRLRLIFTCCHPALNVEAQIALTLRTLGRLTTAEIARAFLVPEATLAQRLVRAKKKIAEAQIPYEVPPRERAAERLTAVLSVLYLIFNEGYSATAGDTLVRTEIASDAIRLARTLCELLPDQPEARGLFALMLLHDARRGARLNSVGELVPLEEQDRALWDRAEIAEGLAQLDSALRLRQPGPYQVQAAIAAIHAQATVPTATDWVEIAALYGQLVRLTPTPIVALNHAVAVAMSQGPSEGLTRIDRLGAFGALQAYPLFHAARADLLRRLGRRTEAHEAYEAALALTTNGVEKRYLGARVAALT